MNYMDAWHSVRQLIILLEYRRSIIDLKIVKIKSHLSQLNLLINEQIREYDLLKQQLNRFIPSGVLNRSEIYRNIRRQGVLLSRQQLYLIKLNQLDDEKIRQEQALQNYQSEKFFLEKKHHKITCNIYRQYTDYRMRSDNHTEDDELELICYDKSKL
ncbi:type III secretion system protein [Erwinia amylovora]|uniref:type III secretion system protein n=1 Tax=Erwinia amylovora TaxID=552 RepID=UPI003209DA77